MACGCGKNNISSTMKSNLDWTISRAKIIAKLRTQDVQIYMRLIDEGTKDEIIIYEIEFPLNPLRNNIIKIIKWQELG